MKKQLILLAFLLFISFSVKPQNSRIDYAEVNLEYEFTKPEFISFGELGIVMSSINNKSFNYETDDYETECSFERFDSDLNSTATKKIFLGSKFYLIDNFSSKNQLHKLYMNRKGNFSFLSVEVSTLEVTKIDGLLPKKTMIKDFTILGDYVFMIASAKKVPFIYIINRKTGEQKQIPITIENINLNKIELKSAQTLESTNEVIVYAKVKTSIYKTSTYGFLLDFKGDITETVNFSEDIKENLIDITNTKVNKDEYIYTGTYSTNTSDKSVGLFLRIVKNGKINPIKFYHFNDLENFLTEDIKAKIKLGEIKSGYNIFQHDLILIDEGYLYIGETYFPTYRTEVSHSSSPSGGISTSTNKVFDGFQYTHALLVKFDKVGNMIEHNAISINPKKTYSIKNFLSIIQKNQDSIKLVFAYSKEIVPFNISLGSQQNKIDINNVEERFKIILEDEYYYSDIDYWYGNYCIEYGPLVEYESGGVFKDYPKKSNIFILNKIKFQ